MVEVLVGALVLGIATFAVLDGLEGAQATGVKNKQRTTSAALAQQDIERLRAIPITSLSNLRQERTVRVAGVDYTVNSRTDWVRDASGTVSCTNDSAQAEYMKVTSVVHSQGSPDRPVREVSLLTPAPGAFSATAGTAAVKISNREGQPRVGEVVELNGPANLSDTTNDIGCAIFGYIPAGSYTAEVTGLVSWSGEPTADVDVFAGKTSLAQMELEAPASIRALLQTPSGATSSWTSLSVANAKLPAGVKEFTSGTPKSTWDVSNLFPFLDGYGVYAGTCLAADPSHWDADYFQTRGKGAVAPDPGDLLEQVVVEMPTVHIRARRSGSPNWNADIVVKQNDAGLGCDSTVFSQRLSSNTVQYDWNALKLPFGHYTVCVDNQGSKSRSVDVDLTTPVELGPVLLTLPSTSDSNNGACPA